MTNATPAPTTPTSNDTRAPKMTRVSKSRPCTSVPNQCFTVGGWNCASDNRLADFGFVLGIFLVWMLSGLGGHDRTFNFTELSQRIPEYFKSGLIAPSMMMGAALLVFCGVVGKSAQFPLYIWLPDAMEGPTPVSALIHAATMVAAGVYLMARSFFLVAQSQTRATFCRGKP